MALHYIITSPGSYHYPRTSLITIHIITFRSHITPQSRLNHTTRASQSEGPAFPVPGEYADELHWHSCRTARRPTYTSNITLGYKA